MKFEKHHLIVLVAALFLVATIDCKKKGNDPKVTPTAPTDLTVYATCGPLIILHWTDNANNESGFKIERSFGGAFAEIDNVAANDSSYTDTSVAASTTYTYRVRAYNSDGPSGYTNEDSAATGSGVAGTPTKVVAQNGIWYKGTMGSGTITPSPVLTVQDAANNPVPGQTINLSLLSGDGTLASSSVVLDSSCTALLGYNFSGSLGHALVKATSGSGLDSVLLTLRASIITPGANYQGQYIITGDNYWKVKQINGPAASIDVDPTYCQTYANYETAKGVVVVIDDADCASDADSAEEVLGVIMNTVYTGKTTSGFGIGSSVAAARASFGTPDSIRLDNSPPPAIALYYTSLGMVLFGNTTDTTIFEIHVTAPPSSSPTSQSRRRGAASPGQATSNAHYRPLH